MKEEYTSSEPDSTVVEQATPNPNWRKINRKRKRNELEAESPKKRKVTEFGFSQVFTAVD